MADGKKIATIWHYVGDTADTKPTPAPVGSTYLDRQTGILYVCYDGVSYAAWDKIVKLAANSGIDIGDVDITSIVPGVAATSLGKAEDAVHASGDTGVMALAVRKDTAAGLAADGDYHVLEVDASGRLHVAPLVAGDNNIGNVDIVTLPAGNLGQQAMAASLSVVPANNVTDATYIGDIKFGEALPAGTAAIGSVKDDGPSVAGTETYTTSADMTTAADIGPAPTGSQKSKLLEVSISSDTAMLFTLQEETAATVRHAFRIPANGTVVRVFRHPSKLATADKKWQGKASVAGSVYITTTTASEA